jgi:simple sugar transport system ATP-binding protein
VAILFATLRKLAAEGRSILYISHKLEEIRALCDAATILRGGRVVAECDPRTASAAELAERMVGAALTAPKARAGSAGEVLLQVTDLSLPPVSAFGTPLRDVSIRLRAGEVLGIGGVAGNGQDELLSVLTGERTSAAGTVVMEGRDVSALGPSARRAAGLLTGPEERLGHAAAPDMSLTENAALTGAARRGMLRRGFLDWAAARGFAEEVIARFDVRTPGPGAAARSLSGGNLQKFVIGREVLQAPRVLVVNQPTWGVDAAAAGAIRQALSDLAAGGAGVIVISQDLDELLAMSDRFAALNEGRLGAPVATADLTMERIGLMLGGAHGMEVAHA